MSPLDQSAICYLARRCEAYLEHARQLPKGSRGAAAAIEKARLVAERALRIAQGKA